METVAIDCNGDTQCLKPRRQGLIHNVLAFSLPARAPCDMLAVRLRSCARAVSRAALHDGPAFSRAICT
eukprot:scaffold140944_cov33-Tisochrysis_lutea.AAC.2